MVYRRSSEADLAALARIRALEWDAPEYWERRIAGYLEGKLNPQQALPPRSCFVALEDDVVAGFVAGHLTRRYGCDGEIQWINVIPTHRSKHVASELLKLLADWFVEQGARRICVNLRARQHRRPSLLYPPWSA